MEKGTIEVGYSVEDNLLKNKNYDLLSFAAITCRYPLISSQKIKRIPQDEFRYQLRTTMGHSQYKTRTLLQAFIDMGLMEEKNNEYIIQPTTDPFVTLKINTIDFCLDNKMDSYTFKVYCFLLHKYQAHVYYHMRDNYFFSEKELIVRMGYGVNGASYEKVKNALRLLEDLGLISYNHNSVHRKNKTGIYKELYAAHQPTLDDNNALPGWEGMKKFDN